jgi:hypothetical protein
MENYLLFVTPMTKEQRKTLVDKDGILTFVIPIDVNTLIEWDIESLNDHACEMAGVVGFSDIDYHIVGNERDEIHLQIRGVVDMAEED